MTAAEAVETSVTTTNSLSEDYTNIDDHISQTSIDTPRFKPFTLLHIYSNKLLTILQSPYLTSFFF